ncbi:tetratricopeptide repeat protein [Massilia putida]|uniref:tetratricopeptide repeat protein n=1 Tax=Massilia putida TaxID=1141883 RepID=UPI000950D87F|nr:tetratricopeptide repeat protein [Massilia putida]
MLQRLLAAFRPRNPAAPAPATHDAIAAYDDQGRQVMMPRAEWRDKVLHPQLKQHWNTPDALYGTIQSALSDGFARELMTAAARLVEIDDRPERSHVTHGIVLLESGRPDEAEAVLQAGIRLIGETAALLTNLAKVTHDRGDTAATSDLLRRAVRLDPNFEHALSGWLAVERERAGEAGSLAALREACGMPNSWRARVLLARHHLAAGDLPAAREQYTAVLAAADVDGGALMTMSADLARHGHTGLIVMLVGPVYEPAKHGPQAGFNLLRACLETERVTEGEALLARLRPLAPPSFTRHLDEFQRAFRRLHATEAHA